MDATSFHDGEEPHTSPAWSDTPPRPDRGALGEDLRRHARHAHPEIVEPPVVDAVTLTRSLHALLPCETATTWDQIALLVPPEPYLFGGAALAVHLRHRESPDLVFSPTGTQSPSTSSECYLPMARSRSRNARGGTLKSLCGETRLRFLQAGRGTTERRLDVPRPSNVATTITGPA